MIYLGPISSVPDQRIALDDVSMLIGTIGWNTPSKWILLFATRVDVLLPNNAKQTNFMHTGYRAWKTTISDNIRQACQLVCPYHGHVTVGGEEAEGYK